MSNLNDHILVLLNSSDSSRKAKWLATELGVTRRAVNSALYSLLQTRTVMVDDQYYWSLWSEDQELPLALVSDESVDTQLADILRSLMG